jgi:hypothetical protein
MTQYRIDPREGTAVKSKAASPNFQVHKVEFGDANDPVQVKSLMNNFAPYVNLAHLPEFKRALIAKGYNVQAPGL